MKWLKQTFWLILNPRAKLDNLPSSGDKSAAEIESSPINIKEILFNPPLILGLLIVLGLFLVVLFGPVWAPQNPYTAGQHIKPYFNVETNEYIRPPLAPSPEFPFGTNRWGSDLLSLLLHGARNTLISAAFITFVRLVLGTLLGGLAGWSEGKTVDRIIMGLIGVTTSIPMLISSMILIYALDIRRGLPVFIIALSMIGWTEIAQYIRSEFLVLRNSLFIESAQAIGSRDIAIAVRHILPNILPQLLVISFLEMGAVLMLMGELGFVGVFIGGGHKIAFFELMAPTQIFTLTEVPEWGAMLAEGYKWLRSKPFVIAPPATAMFVSILGFNFLGEGLRRLIETRSIDTAFLLKKRMLLVVTGLILGTIFIINNTGATPWLIKAAQTFSGESAYQHVEVLSEMDGRAVSQQGGRDAADYIEAKFKEYGLEPGWKKNSFRYLVPALQTTPLEQPALNLLDQNGSVLQQYRHQLDFGFVVEGHGGSGEISYPVTFVGFGPGETPDWRAFSGLDLKDRIVLVQIGNAPDDFASEALLRGAQGVLWISGEGRDDVRSQTLWVNFDEDYLRPPGRPIFRIRPDVAAEMLDQAGTTLDDLYSLTDDFDQSGDGWFVKNLDILVEMSLELSPAENVEIPCVIGYLPGYDLGIGSSMLVLFTTYDGMGTDPDGTVFPAANHNASGTALMMEIAHLWNEESIEPRRSVMFVAWSSELGIDQARDFFNTRTNFFHLISLSSLRRVAPEIFIQLDFAGAGGEELLIHPDSSGNLIDILEESARVTEVPINIKIDTPDFSTDLIAENMRWLSLRWEDAAVSPPEDTSEHIQEEKLRSLGETLTLFLLKLVREADF